MESRDVPVVHQYGMLERRFAISESMPGFWTEQQLYRWLEKESDVLLVAEVQSEIAGFMFSSLNEETGKAQLENLFVKEDYRGKGIGIILIEDSLKRLEEKGSTYYVSLIEPDNEIAMSLFEYFGFRRGKVMLWMDKTS